MRKTITRRRSEDDQDEFADEFESYVVDRSIVDRTPSQDDLAPYRRMNGQRDE